MCKPTNGFDCNAPGFTALAIQKSKSGCQTLAEWVSPDAVPHNPTEVAAWKLIDNGVSMTVHNVKGCSDGSNHTVIVSFLCDPQHAAPTYPFSVTESPTCTWNWVFPTQFACIT